MQKLTKAFVEKLPFEPSGQKFYRDPDLKGFGLRVSKTVKVYIAESKLHGKTIRATIARHNVITVDEARTKAKKILAEISEGKNPHDVEKARKSKLVTLAEVLESYIELRTNLKPSSIQDYRQTLSVYLGDWLNKPIIEITKDMIEARFRKLSKFSPSRANKTMRNLRAILNYAIVKYEDNNGESFLRQTPLIV